MHFKNKTIFTKWDKMFIWGKKGLIKERFWFHEKKIPVRWKNLLSIEQILIFQ